jgi:hypothetical protein
MLKYSENTFKINIKFTEISNLLNHPAVYKCVLINMCYAVAWFQAAAAK